MARNSKDAGRRELGPFERAALTSRFVGVAALTLGAVALYAEKNKPPREAAAGLLFAFMFIVPGLLYLLLPTWVMRRRRWAVLTSQAVAMIDMMLLGVLFVSSWGVPGAWPLLVLAGLFVVALGVMTTFLGRSLAMIKRIRST